jgi:hypothetical protein
MTPLAPCEPRQVTTPISYLSEQGTLPTTSLISMQAVPYRTHGSTCCPRVSTPKTRSLADLSMTIHIMWWNPTISTILTLLKPQHRSSPWSPHITTDGRPTLDNNTSQTQHHKDGKTCMTLMTTWLSITNQVWTQILSMRLRYSIKACREMCTLEREREHIGSIWSRVTCLALQLAAAQSLECRAPRDSRSLRRLMVAIGNKQHKKITKQCPITKQTVVKDATHRYECVSATIT